MPRENEFRAHDESSEKIIESEQQTLEAPQEVFSETSLREKENQILESFNDYIAVKKALEESIKTDSHATISSAISLAEKDPDATRRAVQELIDKNKMDSAGQIAIQVGDDNLLNMVHEAGGSEKVEAALGNVEPYKKSLESWSKQDNFPSDNHVKEMISVLAEKYPDDAKNFLEVTLAGRRDKYRGEGYYKLGLEAVAIALAKSDPDYARKLMQEDLNYQYGGLTAGRIACALGDLKLAKEQAERCLKGSSPDVVAEIAVAIGDDELAKKALENAKRFGPRTVGSVAIKLDDVDAVREALRDCSAHLQEEKNRDEREGLEKSVKDMMIFIAEKDIDYGKEAIKKYFANVSKDRDGTISPATFAGGVPFDAVQKISLILADKDPAAARDAMEIFSHVGNGFQRFSSEIQAEIFKKNVSRIHVSPEESAKILETEKGRQVPLVMGWFLDQEDLNKALENVDSPTTRRAASLGELIKKGPESSQRELLDLAFSSPSSPDFERALAKSLIFFDYEQVSNILMQKIQNVKDEKILARYLKTLIEIENPKGRTMATDLFANQEANPHLRRYFAKKLIAEKHWDPKLGPVLQESIKEGKKKEVDDTLVAMIKDLGLTPDKPSYEALEKPGILRGVTLQERVQELKSLRQEFAELSHDKLKERLKDEKIRQFYYLVKGGEYRYTLINDYSYEKFSMIVGKVLEQEVDEERISEFEKSLEAAKISSEQRQFILQSLREGRFPLENPEQRSFSFETSVEIGSEYEIAFQRLQEIWGRELKVLAATSEQEGELPLGIDDALANLEAKEIEKPKSKRALEFLKQGEKQDYKSIKKMSEMCKKELIASLKQKAKQLKDKDTTKEKLAELERLNISGVLHAFIVERLPNLKDSAVLSEWESHLRDTLSTLEAGPVNGGTKNKRLELTFLDKGKDFIRSVRFGDGRQCCFNSSNYSPDGGGGVGASEWISKLNADPLSFIVDVKEEDSRIISGFVFGRMGIDPETKRPVVMCNGIYSQESGGAVANNILRLIEEKFAKRIGASSVVIASKYGGTLSQTPTGFTPVEKEIQAVRALKRGDKVYDDIGTVPNGPFNFKGYERKLS